MRPEVTIQTKSFPIRKWDFITTEINLCICFVVVSHGTHSCKPLLFYSLPQDPNDVWTALQGLL